MLSFLSSVPEWFITFFSSNFELVIGYIICVLFPIPYVNGWIISLWASLLSAEKAAGDDVQPPTPTPPTT